VLAGVVVAVDEVGVFPVVADRSVEMPEQPAAPAGAEATGATGEGEGREGEAKAVALDVVPALLAPMRKYL
jgi:hypothetical protein